jgi:5-methylcytosine-specific restriction endonuclease McrA
MPVKPPHRNSAQQFKDRARIARAKPNCAICGKPIDYTLKWPDAQCFVVDHIIPLVKGGRDDLTNKQAAHATCNSTKRARDYAPIIRRSGALER